ncbi:rifin PIR protein, putative [Plasmodium reichenowi]|uniref:Rifin PIR protein, putative n=1 Tax=Plasmodium reichenowi TaxID=5854 RepID=A0A2P9DHC6_PLARE|nr:rifin PIR protein, putative [Plasmodium reichenowi]
MKVHYINILLFAHALNILVKTHKKNTFSTHHIPKIQTTRLLCECKLYAPANYDNDAEMKEVIENFNKQTQQRFHEYDERMKTTRQKCKEKCDKEIEKIILKDKIEKELMDKFATLQTDIQSDAIPTCICENSLADKVEKNCMKCTQNLGGIVAPSSGVLVGIAEGALYAWKPEALKVAIAKAITEGTAKITVAGIEAGKKVVFGGLDALNIAELKIGPWESFLTTGYNIHVKNLASVILKQRQVMCGAPSTLDIPTCDRIGLSIGTYVKGGYAPPGPEPIETVLNGIIERTKEAADAAAKIAEKGVTTGITEKETGVINTIFMSKQTAIIASIIAIVVIILIMVIIYLILRYRRKTKMKKKLQYIKLLEE